MENWKVFVIVMPGLEDLALKEIEIKIPIANPQVIKGGIEIDANLDWIEQAHLLLKIPTRILLRMTEFKVRDFPKLHQKFLNFNWKNYLSHPEPVWEISCSKSRLNHTGRMEETIKAAMKKMLVSQPLNQDWIKKNYSPQTFYIRLFDDTLTLSLDLTGEPLHKRGLQTIKGEAPLRENLAAAFLFEIFADIQSPVTLIDPMCGSGTFLTEAMSFHLPLHLRSFDFETAPFYKGRILNTKNSPEIMKFPIEKALGFDVNAELIQKLKTDFAIEFTGLDSLIKKITSDENTIIICNPPYGERIKIEGKRGSFLKSAWEKFINTDRPLRFGWVLPSDMDDLFKAPAGYHILQKRHLRNGGMAVTFWIFERN